MVLLPKTSSRSSNDRAFEPLAVVMYENDGVALLATVLDYRKNKYHLLNQRGREVDLAVERLYPFHTKVPATLNTVDARSAYLQDLYDTSEREALVFNVEELWTLVNEEGKDFGTAELCQLYYGNTELSRHLVMRLALLRDKIFFKRRKEIFEPRPLSTIEELRRAEEIRKEKLELQERAVEFFAAKRKDSSVTIPEALMTIIRLLEDTAADADSLDEGRRRDAKELIALLCDRLHLQPSGSQPQRAFALLELIGYFDHATNLPLIRHKPPLTFSQEVLDAAASIIPSDVIASGIFGQTPRRDLTSLHTITIDDQRTRDMDDALSIQRSRDGFQLGIHISDVASSIAIDSLLDREAARRSTSLYLPEQTINMFPELLCHDRLSLIEGKQRPCISYLFEIDSSLNIISWEIIPSTISTKHRLSYDQANALLDARDPDLELLHQIAATCEMKRFERGGMRVHKRDAVGIPHPDGSVTLEEVDEESPARVLVSEMMVLANGITAEFASRKGLPLIFRGQEPPDPSQMPREDRIPEGPARDFAIRVNLKKSITALRPMSHASLGLAAYAQATSPIRRYSDLCNQRQLASLLIASKPYYTANALQEELDRSDQNLARGNLISRETKRLWLLRYLSNRRKNNDRITATVVRTDLKTPLVELDEIYITTQVKLKAPIALGDVVTLRIVQVDPEFDELRLEQRAD